MNLLITGATGNIGIELIRRLRMMNTGVDIFAGVRDLDKAKKANEVLKDVHCRIFDFEDANTHRAALQNIETVFLLRPPQISNIKKYFEPLLASISAAGVKKIVFLSVQGAEKSKIIPHRKIELLILKFQLEYIFMRPSYFMQNLTTTLIHEIHEQRTITLPAGDAKFNWLDIEDIAKLGAEFIANFQLYKNHEFTISGTQNLNFHEVVSRINTIAKTNIKYTSADPITFLIRMKRLGFDTGMIVVMFILHFLPRIQGDPVIVNTYRKIFGIDPGTIENFIDRNKGKFI